MLDKRDVIIISVIGNSQIQVSCNCSISDSLNIIHNNILEDTKETLVSYTFDEMLKFESNRNKPKNHKSKNYKPKNHKSKNYKSKNNMSQEVIHE